MELKPGMKFRFKGSNPNFMGEIYSITGNILTLESDGRKTLWFKSHFLRDFDYISDEPYKREYHCTINPHIPKRCNHVWRKDYFFSLQAYHTCIKCGAKQEETHG